MDLISPAEALYWLSSQLSRVAAIDVRSPKEFMEGSVTGFVNLPILTDPERHAVGLCYAQNGQDSAIRLGHQLVESTRQKRIESWIEHLKQGDIRLVSCWRGGLRSQIACEWLRESNVPALRIGGGYKSLRRHLVTVFENLPDLIVIAGPTGSNKTSLLNSLQTPALDLEKHACHRGSAFGAILGRVQPSQSSFENTLALQISRLKANRIAVEDESFTIGHVALPAPLKRKIEHSPVVRVLTSLEERTLNIYKSYVEDPLANNISREDLKSHYESAVNKISRRLGGKLASEILGQIHEAFEGKQNDSAAHFAWIQNLLRHYYDKLYEESFKRHVRKTVFEGDWQSCRMWIQNQYD